MNRQRLLQLVRVLRAVAANGQPMNLTGWTLPIHVRPGDENSAVCGTSCCAVGWAALDPWFQEQGLVLKAYDGSVDDHVRVDDVATLIRVHGNSRCGCPYPHHQDDRGYGAVATFFDIEHAMSVIIFAPDKYDRPDDPAAVIARALAFVVLDIVSEDKA